MNERPILMNGAMVRATLAGIKTQTRRIVRPYKPTYKNGGKPVPAFLVSRNDAPQFVYIDKCPYGQPGDQLWVRETFCPIYPQDPTYNGGLPIEYDYAATYKHGNRLGDLMGDKKVWKPSIHMPRWASRIQLEITGIRVERLQDCSEADALAEGVISYPVGNLTVFGVEGTTIEKLSPKAAYFALWDEINGRGAADANPLVWVVEFKVIKP